MSVSEIQKKLLKTLNDDADLADVLESDSSVFKGWPNATPSFPFVSLRWNHMNPNRDGSIVKKWRPELQINVYTFSEYKSQDVVNYLMDNYTIPVLNNPGITSDNYRIDEMRMVGDSNPLPFSIETESNDIFHVASIWNLAIKLSS